MKNFKLLLPMYGMVFIFWQACSSGSKETASGNQSAIEAPQEVTYTGARLVQVDSIMIDVIGNLGVYDYQPQSGLFLAGDIAGLMTFRGKDSPKMNQIGHLVFDRKGKILHQFNNANRGPEGHSTGANGHAFLGPDEIGVMSRKALHRYGIDGSFKKRYTSLNLLDVLSYPGGRFVLSADGQHLALGIPKGMEAAGRAWDSLYQIGKPLWFYDLEGSGELAEKTDGAFLKASYGFPDHPIYAPESKIDHSPIPPKMALKHTTNELLSVYGQIPVMTVYDMATGQIKEEINLEPEHFACETEVGHSSGGTAGHGGLLWLNKGGRLANSSYHQIVQLGDYTLLRYSPPLPPSIVSGLVASPSVLRKNEDWPRIRKKHYRFYYQLFKDGEKVLPDFKIPLLEPKMGQPAMTWPSLTSGRIIGGNGLDEIFVFVSNNGDEERDYELIRVYKLELISE